MFTRQIGLWSLCVLLSQLSWASGLEISEVMSSNRGFLALADGSSPDWIEIHNPTASTINTTGYYLSDNEDILQKWALPAIDIPAGGFKLVYASGADTSLDPWHANFKLASRGEKLWLSSGSYQFSFPAVLLPANHSFGLIEGKGFFFQDATPARPNTFSVGISQPGGYYDVGDAIQVHIPAGQQVLYTIDNTNPLANGIACGGTILLDQPLRYDNPLSQVSTSDYWTEPFAAEPMATILKLVSIASGEVQINMQHTFFPSEAYSEWPLLSLTTDAAGLVSADSGIFVAGIHQQEWNPGYTGNYFMRGIEWERATHFAWYEPSGEEGVNQLTGMRVSGANRRLMPQKTLRIYARKDYGKNDIDYDFFDQKEVRSFKRLGLRGRYGSWGTALTEDKLAHRLVRNLNVDAQAQRSVLVYINGEYWGIYDISERQDKHYIESHYGVDEDSVEITDNYTTQMVTGDSANMAAIHQFISENDLTEQANYRYVEDRVDLSNFIDYQIAEIYFGNYDWPGNNLKLWRSARPAGKWRWFFYDLDAGFSRPWFNTLRHTLDPDNENWPNHHNSTLWFRKLMENEHFNARFLQRLESLISEEFHPQEMIGELNAIYAEYLPEISRHLARWHGTDDTSVWDKGMGAVRNFARHRACTVRENVLDAYNVYLTTNVCGKNGWEVESLQSTPNPNNGTFAIEFEASVYSHCRLQVINSTGTAVYRQEIQCVSGSNSLQVDLDVVPGIYFVQLTNDLKSVGSKVIVR